MSLILASQNRRCITHVCVWSHCWCPQYPGYVSAVAVLVMAGAGWLLMAGGCCSFMCLNRAECLDLPMLGCAVVTCTGPTSFTALLVDAHVMHLLLSFAVLTGHPHVSSLGLCPSTCRSCRTYPTRQVLQAVHGGLLQEGLAGADIPGDPAIKPGQCGAAVEEAGHRRPSECLIMPGFLGHFVTVSMAACVYIPLMWSWCCVVSF